MPADRPGVVQESPVDRPAPSWDTSKNNKSRITNGALLPGADGRSAWARRARDVLEAHLSDLGGDRICSEAQKSIARRCAALTVELELMEQTFALANGASEAQFDIYQRTANSLRRLLVSIGLERRQRTVPSLVELMDGPI